MVIYLKQHTYFHPPAAAGAAAAEVAAAADAARATTNALEAPVPAARNPSAFLATKTKTTFSERSDAISISMAAGENAVQGAPRRADK